ncbi:MAG: ribosome assembly cofactor RimP [Candidatus Symbiothrix sp.]|jgi:ribosome maturation factor RimP|nr:ribosome assembly cofactor RimP [Candidatus Symbiothrix sp.]
MIEKKVIIEAVAAFLKDSENYLVDIDVKPGNLIRIEIDNDRAVFIDDCVALSRYVESQLNREEEDYELEVGSSGIGQAFKNPRQYRKNIGNEVELLTKSGIKYTGILKDAGEEEVVLTVAKRVKPEGAKRKIQVEEELTFSYNEIKHTKYLIRFK